MNRSLWLKFLVVLIIVAAVGLSSTFLLRELMVRDFRDYLEGEREDRAHWVIASIESAYEKKGGWDRGEMIDSAIWAFMLGMDLTLLDAEGSVLIDMEMALSSLPPLVQKRVLVLADRWDMSEGGERVPYALFLRGERIGSLEVRFLPPRKEAVFIERSNKFLMVSLIALGGLALALSVVFSRRLTRPIKELTSAASQISEGDLTSRVRPPGSDELGELSRAFNRMAEALTVQESLRKKLTANVAHELRTPISAVRGELEGMIDGLIPAERDNLQSLYDEISRLKGILNGIEDLSQVEASSMSLIKRPIELKPFLSAIVERYSGTFREKGVSLELDCDERLKAEADPDRLSQVMVNLLTNALKATEPGGRVRVAVRATDGGVRIDVLDTGSGIRKEELPFIFERFYRASEGGLGIGLTIVKELVEAHGGTIEVQSEPGRGSTFTISLVS